MSRKFNRLTGQMLRFIEEYLKDKEMNAAKANERANGAYEDGDRMLAYPQVKREIRKRLKLIENETNATAVKVVTELWRVANSDMGDYFDAEGNIKPFSAMSPEARRAIASIEVDEIFQGNGTGNARTVVGETKKIKLWPKVHALEVLAKKFKLLTDKMEVSVSEDLALAIQAARKRRQGAK